MKQPDLYYFETIKMTSQAWSNFVWRIRAAGEYSLWTLTRFVTSFAWFQNGIDQAVSQNKCGWVDEWIKGWVRWVANVTWEASLHFITKKICTWFRVVYSIVPSLNMGTQFWDILVYPSNYMFQLHKYLNWIFRLIFLELYCWFHGSSFKGFSIVFPAPLLAKVESSQKSNGMWFFRHFFAPFLFHRSRNNRRYNQPSKFWREKMSRKPHLKLLRWFLVDGTNNVTI